MCAAVLFTYRSPDLFNGNWRIHGMDYAMLHRWRIEYAQDAIRREHAIPACYSREFMGSPFWSNRQNFPLIPTRLVLLWLNARDIFTIEAYLLALAAALFTFLYARAIGLSPLSAATAGFTFACAGFYVSRMAAGQIGILEVYSSLPAILWIVHRLCVPTRASPTADYTPSAKWYLALALAIVSFSLAAHPQIFIYAIAAGGLYLIWRCRNWKTFLRTAAVMALSLGVAGVLLYPMSRLVGRSSRMLELDPATNDLPFRFDRLPAMFFPWHNGAPPHLNAPPGTSSLPIEWTTGAAFWDAVDYVGKIPVICAALLIAFIIWRVIRGARDDDQTSLLLPASADAKFLAAMALVGLALALPVFGWVLSWVPNRGLPAHS